ncbi:hypothetical protein [Hymenobacter sp. PAMC 26628]|uniref:hypothetical protein n=1 Tax=Hymenobacter sp. PAMC 26628 TaxID=1484118 RepID=UPI0007703C4C|nr:hypothetical protein [Hymenobacter sp. PAMC 26628]AMJ65055.1 hypothetical protein AXW84_06140 [Hymenobacter sp. PAMC 26628]
MPETYLDFRLAGESLDLGPDTQVQFEFNSPLFETDTLPGTLAYPFRVDNTPKNRRLLAFPGYLAAARVRNQVFAADLYLCGLLWRRGQLSVVKRSADGFDLSFQTDAGDVQRRLVDLQLAAVPLPTVPLDFNGGAWPAVLYALPTVANALFYDENATKTLQYRGLVNAFANGSYDAGQPVVPMVYLRTVIDAICQVVGYSLAGTFFADPEIQALVLYSNQAVDPAANAVALARHLPDQSVPDAIKAVRALFCLCTVFDPVQRQFVVDALRDVLADPRYLDWTDRAEAAFDWEPNVTAGFWLEQKLDGGDDLSKNAPASQYLLKIDGAQEKITVDAGSLAMQRGPATPTSPTGSDTLLPVTVQKGNTPLLPDATDNKTTLRLLFHRGRHPDAAGAPYPLASAEALDYSGQLVGRYSLRWDGPHGLYATWHKDWLAFRARTETVTRGVRLRVADLLQLDPRRKVLIRAAEGTTLAFWKQIQVTISQKDGILVAQIPFYKI